MQALAGTRGEQAPCRSEVPGLQPTPSGRRCQRQAAATRPPTHPRGRGEQASYPASSHAQDTAGTASANSSHLQAAVQLRRHLPVVGPSSARPSLASAAVAELAVSQLSLAVIELIRMIRRMRDQRRFPRLPSLCAPARLRRPATAQPATARPNLRLAQPLGKAHPHQPTSPPSGTSSPLGGSRTAAGRGLCLSAPAACPYTSPQGSPSLLLTSARSRRSDLLA